MASSVLTKRWKFNLEIVNVEATLIPQFKFTVEIILVESTLLTDVRKSLKITKGYWEVLIRRTMTKIKRTKRQTIVARIQHIKLQIKQFEHHLKTWGKSDFPEESAVVAHLMLLLNSTLMSDSSLYLLWSTQKQVKLNQLNVTVNSTSACWVHKGFLLHQFYYNQV